MVNHENHMAGNRLIALSARSTHSHKHQPIIIFKYTLPVYLYGEQF
jgi:hypothetical protein